MSSTFKAVPNHPEENEEKSSKNNAVDEFGLPDERTQHFSIPNGNHGVSRL